MEKWYRPSLAPALLVRSVVVVLDTVSGCDLPRVMFFFFRPSREKRLWKRAAAETTQQRPTEQAMNHSIANVGGGQSHYSSDQGKRTERKREKKAIAFSTAREFLIRIFYRPSSSSLLCLWNLAPLERRTGHNFSENRRDANANRAAAADKQGWQENGAIKSKLPERIERVVAYICIFIIWMRRKRRILGPTVFDFQMTEAKVTKLRRRSLQACIPGGF